MKRVFAKFGQELVVIVIFLEIEVVTRLSSNAMGDRARNMSVLFFEYKYTP